MVMLLGTPRICSKSLRVLRVPLKAKTLGILVRSGHPDTKDSYYAGLRIASYGTTALPGQYKASSVRGKRLPCCTHVERPCKQKVVKACALGQ